MSIWHRDRRMLGRSCPSQFGPLEYFTVRPYFSQDFMSYLFPCLLYLFSDSFIIRISVYYFTGFILNHSLASPHFMAFIAR